VLRLRPIKNEAAALKQRIAIRAAQNINHIKIADTKREGFAALGAN
jgi:hypothetical protein